MSVFANRRYALKGIGAAPTGIESGPLVWAAIVCFQPDDKLLLDLINRLSPQVGMILILNNGGLSVSLITDICKSKNVRFFNFNENIGIASALNRGFAEAATQGIDFMVTFDQDSLPVTDHVQKLLCKWQELSLNQTPSAKVGAIGPSFYDARGKRIDYPFYRSSGMRVVKEYFHGRDVVPVDALITSGMLVPVKMWSEGLRFIDKLFVDFIDTEWCFRSKSFGYIHYGSFDVKMRHTLSDSAPIKFLGLIILSYSPLRRYYHFRNCLYLISRSYTPYSFRFRLISGLLLRLVAIFFVDEKPDKSFQAALLGICDSFRGRFGKKSL